MNDDTPDDDHDHEGGTPLLEAHVHGDTLHCSINLEDPDPAFWGQVMADLTRHIAEGLAEQEGGDPVDVLRQVREALNAQLDNPPDDEDDA